MKYTTGTISVTNGSALVTGSGTLWSGRLKQGDLISVDGTGVWHWIATVIDNETLYLSTGYTLATQSNATYTAIRGFSPNYGFPLVSRFDVEKASLAGDAVHRVDQALRKLDDRIFLLEYPPVTPVPMVSVPTIDSIAVTVSTAVTADSDKTTADSNTVTADSG